MIAGYKTCSGCGCLNKIGSDCPVCYLKNTAMSTPSKPVTATKPPKRAKTPSKPDRSSQEPPYDKIDHPIPHPQPEHHQTPALGGTTQGKEKGMERVRVRFTGYRCRPLDPDNFAGSVKDCLDFLRHARLIDGDEPWRIILETEQVKVGKRSEEKTTIEIF